MFRHFDILIKMLANQNTENSESCHVRLTFSEIPRSYIGKLRGLRTVNRPSHVSAKKIWVYFNLLKPLIILEEISKTDKFTDNDLKNRQILELSNVNKLNNNYIDFD